MAFETLAQLRARLNTDLGVADGATLPWGDATVRNAAIREGFERLWPQMKRLRTESQTYVAGQQLYTLTSVIDVQLVEVKSSDGIVYKDLKNWRNWVVDDDTPVTTFRLSSGIAETGATLEFTGYAPYESDLTSDTDACDLDGRYTWIPLQGARSYLYRRKYHEYLDYQQFANINRENDTTPQTLFAAYQDAENRFEHAVATHAAQVSMPRRARMTK